jgi:hypothetical protein
VNVVSILAVVKAARAGALVSVALVAACSSAGSQEVCKVADAELQGFYEGGCRRGLAHGTGYARGTAEYEGELRNGLKHGRGVKTWAWGDRYEGDFLQDRKHGEGMYVWGVDSPWAGERYVGGFKADKREGFGTYFWPNGDRFEGQWKEDLRYGSTPMEQRRELARKAREEAFAAVGTTVCRGIPVGLAYEAGLKGETLGLEEGRLKVKITEVSEPEPGIRPSIEVGSVVVDDIWDWRVCL